MRLLALSTSRAWVVQVTNQGLFDLGSVRQVFSSYRTDTSSRVRLRTEGAVDELAEGGQLRLVRHEPDGVRVNLPKPDSNESGPRELVANGAVVANVELLDVADTLGPAILVQPEDLEAVLRATAGPVTLRTMP